MVAKAFDVEIEGVVDPVVITMKHAALVEADAGKMANVSANKTVGLTVDGGKFDGQLVVINEKEGICSLKLSGVMEAVYSGAAPGTGRVKFLTDAAGGVKVDAVNGEEYLVLSVDAASTTVWFIKK